MSAMSVYNKGRQIMPRQKKLPMTSKLYPTLLNPHPPGVAIGDMFIICRKAYK